MNITYSKTICFNGSSITETVTLEEVETENIQKSIRKIREGLEPEPLLSKTGEFKGYAEN